MNSIHLLKKNAVSGLCREDERLVIILGWLIDGVPYVSEQGTTFRSIWCVVENLSYEMLV